MRATRLILALFIVLAAGSLVYKTFSSSSYAEFGGASLRLEYALSPEERAQGLGGRERLEDGYAMLFAFPQDGLHGFWMKDMRFPIDIFWLDSSLTVVSMSLRVAPDTYPDVLYPRVPARYVLETVAGLAEAYGVATGTSLVLKSPPNVSE